MSSKREESTYVADAESAEEMARLMLQDRLLTQGMGGVFPENPDLSHVQRVLDVACGPGGWALDVAFRYMDIQVLGVDISERMIAYANAQARTRQYDNVTFQVMNILSPLAFEDASFDLINARFIAAFMHQEMWSKLFMECQRLLRPGGIFRITEFEWGMSNKPAYEKICYLIHQALNKLKHNFSPNGLHYGIVQMLPRFFRDAGFQQIGKMAHVIDFSAGTDIRDSFHSDSISAFQSLEGIIVKTQLLTSEAWRELCRQASEEMYEENFCGMWLPLTVWGTKPVTSE